MTKARRFLPALVISVALVAVLFLAVLPTRTWLSQRQQLDAAEARVEVLDEQNRKLAARVAELQTDEEIERLAREHYQLVKPGEEAYAILPAPVEEPLPEQEEAAEPDEGGLVERLWRAIVD